ncbi:MAG: hypothetical protein J5I91_01645 [Bacteroidetes bacterium]|nr:hypothetical protein [Bacteroidota bacterium]
MAKVLFFPLHIAWKSHYETELEIMQRHLDAGDEVIQLVCNRALETCDINPEHVFSKCVSCIARRKAGLKLIQGKVKSLPFNKLNSEQERLIRNFQWEAENINELKSIVHENFDIGYAVASSLISMLSNPFPDIEKNKTMINKMMKTSLEVYYSFINQLSYLKPDKVYIFNGRLFQVKAGFRASQKLNVPCFIHERGSTFKHYELFENHLPHDLKMMGIKIKKYWDDEPDEEKKRIKGAEFFEKRRKGIELSWKSFIENQEKGLLPAGFDPNKKNIMIFNSSEFEFASVGPEWNNPLYKNQNEGIIKIVKDFSADTDYHFYLRMHPNLADANPVNYEELLNLNAPNLSIIMPDSPIDSYHLLDMAHKVVTFGSTMGIEASFWGKTSIMAGHSLYESLDAVYRPSTHQELLSMIKDENLKPKAKEHAMIFGYYFNTSGILYKYYEAESYKEGKYRGVKLEPVFDGETQKWLNRYWVYRKYPFMRTTLEKIVLKKLIKE